MIFLLNGLFIFFTGLVAATRRNVPSAAALASQNLIKEVYCREKSGAFQVYKKGHQVLPAPVFVIANGGGGQAGMIEFLAKNFLMQLNTLEGIPFPFCIGWWASNTHGSHEAVQKGTADLAIVYDINRIKEAVSANEIMPNPEHIWMDRFAFIGPPNMIAEKKYSTVEFATTIMETKNAYFLTRVDKSTAYYRESDLFAKIVERKRQFFGLDELKKSELLDLMVYQGWKSMPMFLQVQSGVVYQASEIQKIEALIANDRASRYYNLYQASVRPDFYRPMIRLPKEAAQTANALKWFTLSDNGIFMSLPPQDRRNLLILLNGRDQYVAEDAFFLNPAFLIKSSRARENVNADEFLNYLKQKEVKKLIVPSFRGRLAPSDATVDDSIVTPQLAARQALYESPREAYQSELNSLLHQNKHQRTKSAGSFSNLFESKPSVLRRPASQDQLSNIEEELLKLSKSLQRTA
jgi:hypothetical protein